MTSSSLPLYIAIGLLMVDSTIELSLISSVVAWLHRRAGGSWEVAYNNSSFSLHGKPLHELVDQGHLSNGAAGTAFVLVGTTGTLVLLMRNRSNLWRKGFTKTLYMFWLIATVLSAILTLCALIFTFLVTNTNSGLSINLRYASILKNQPYPNQVPYDLGQWTPENWFHAVLRLDLVHQSERDIISTWIAVMRGARYNLIPMFVIGVAVVVLALWDANNRRRKTTDYRGTMQVKEIQTT
ncbi:hypothetical protein LTS08_000331 [Lithohypha guttulata]|nr:hypothetical protein LTS08_000331 [Lithohypha guttulata]